MAFLGRWMARQPVPHTGAMSRSDPSSNVEQAASDSSRDSLVVRDELPDELPILDEELLWLSDLFASILASTQMENKRS